MKIHQVGAYNARNRDGNFEKSIYSFLQWCWFDCFAKTLEKYAKNRAANWIEWFICYYNISIKWVKSIHIYSSRLHTTRQSKYISGLLNANDGKLSFIINILQCISHQMLWHGQRLYIPVIKLNYYMCHDGRTTSKEEKENELCQKKSWISNWKIKIWIVINWLICMRQWIRCIHDDVYLMDEFDLLQIQLNINIMGFFCLLRVWCIDVNLSTICNLFIVCLCCFVLKPLPWLAKVLWPT